MSLVEIQSTEGPFDRVDPKSLSNLASNGFVIEPLYHGSSQQFDVLDHRKSRTADFIYTTPDPETALAYGDHLYLCVGRQDPQADLIDDHQLVGRLAQTFAGDYYDTVQSDEDLQAMLAELVEQHADDPDYDEMAAEQDPAYRMARLRKAAEWVTEMIRSGDTYGVKGRFQDSLMAECFGLGFKSVRFQDLSSSGESLSVVFQTSDDVVVVKKLA